MATSSSAQKLLRIVLLSSLGLAAIDLLRPHDVHAQSCTPDPLGGEVCLPVEEPESPEDTNNSSNTEGAQDTEGSKGSNNAANDPDDDNNNRRKDPKRVVIVPPCFGPVSYTHLTLPTTPYV